MKAFIAPQFSYFLLTWMFRSRKLNSSINKLHELFINSLFFIDKFTKYK